MGKELGRFAFANIMAILQRVAGFEGSNAGNYVTSQVTIRDNVCQ